MASLVTLTEGSTFAGEYRVARLLARGATGAVFVVEEIGTGEQRALELMHPDLVQDETSRARFVEAARESSRIDSEHVVDVLSAGIDEATGAPYLVMELLEGADLGTYVERAGALAPAQVRDLMEQIGHALGDAHAKGIIHADLKPESLFLTSSPRDGAGRVAKILDFGIARALSGGRAATTGSSTFGPPLYWAPEWFEADAKLCPATDVWALGLITFQLLTARAYWVCANRAEVDPEALRVEIETAPLVPPSKRAAALRARSLPDGFDAWFARCVHRDPDQRFQDGRLAIDALAKVLTGPGVPFDVDAGKPLGAISLDAISSSPDRPPARTRALENAPPAPPVPPRRPSESTGSTIMMVAGAVFVGLLAVGTLWVLNQPNEPLDDDYPDVVGNDDGWEAPIEPVEAVPPPPVVEARETIAAPPDVSAPPADAERSASGLASRVLIAGSGSSHPGPRDRVTVHYTGWTTDGQMFDSSRIRGRDATFGLHQVIPGWTEAVQLMVEGEHRRLWIPANLAYEGRPGAPQGMLVFDVELIRFEPG